MRLAEEDCGSPQLMQRICLDVCFDLGFRQEQKERVVLNLDRTRLQSILVSPSHFRWDASGDERAFSALFFVAIDSC